MPINYSYIQFSIIHNSQNTEVICVFIHTGIEGWAVMHIFLSCITILINVCIYTYNNIHMYYYHTFNIIQAVNKICCICNHLDTLRRLLC